MCACVFNRRRCHFNGNRYKSLIHEYNTFHLNVTVKDKVVVFSEDKNILYLITMKDAWKNELKPEIVKMMSYTCTYNTYIIKYDCGTLLIFLEKKTSLDAVSIAKNLIRYILNTSTYILITMHKWTISI